MSKYQQKYRVASARAQWRDYGWNGAYFITICTAYRRHLFGHIKNNEMYLSPLGVIADIFWHEIPKHADDVELGRFVVMPNHIHGILILNKPFQKQDENANMDVVVVETRHALSLQQQPGFPQTIGQTRFQNQGKNTVSSIIGSYKSVVTKHANRMGLDNGWQDRFHDHIIRDYKEYTRIDKYITDNVNKWEDDRFYKS